MNQIFIPIACILVSLLIAYAVMGIRNSYKSLRDYSEDVADSFDGKEK